MIFIKVLMKAFDEKVMNRSVKGFYKIKACSLFLVVIKTGNIK
jgi:hypothetical protein